MHLGGFEWMIMRIWMRYGTCPDTNQNLDFSMFDGNLPSNVFDGNLPSNVFDAYPMGMHLACLIEISIYCVCDTHMRYTYR
jgi:hypothetical protein